MEVIITAHMFYCSSDRSTIAFSKDPKGKNLPNDICANWMHWKSITLAGNLEDEGPGEVRITDNHILKGLMRQGYFTAEERDIHTVHGLYQNDRK